MYYTGQSGKNLQVMKIMLQTKFKVQVDLGFLQYSLDGDKISIFRIYISRIYRKMNYTAFTYLELLKLLMEKHPAADRWSIFILERNQNIHKFFKYMGLKIEKVITDSKNKNSVDYYQEFSIKKKDLQTAISAFKWHLTCDCSPMFFTYASYYQYQHNQYQISCLKSSSTDWGIFSRGMHENPTLISFGVFFMPG